MLSGRLAERCKIPFGQGPIEFAMFARKAMPMAVPCKNQEFMHAHQAEQPRIS